ncbi:MAG: hypothetical protein EZS28_051461 [Streblomastix strix]|uniref:Uncharacterized protein n=1 Tax=Streblomastix strix TaxID=222440 RepID=A0A5J4T4U2_9EUKA|nr:MAG: hypothetical protein EZS28_051461 [Streblomastix strix]
MNGLPVSPTSTNSSQKSARKGFAPQNSTKYFQQQLLQRMKQQSLIKKETKQQQQQQYSQQNLKSSYTAPEGQGLPIPVVLPAVEVGISDTKPYKMMETFHFNKIKYHKPQLELDLNQ